MTSPSDLMDNGEFPDLTSRLKTWETPIPTLPKALERAAIIKKLDEQLGMQVEVVDNGVNGVVVRSISKTSCVHKDGRLQVGDFILTINNESLRKVSNAQARAILRRAQLAGSEVSVTYIPGGDAAVHRESVLIQSKEELSRAIRNFPRLTTPSSPYLNRGDQVKKAIEKRVDSEFQTTDYRDHPELQRSSTAPSFISKELKSAYSSQFSLTGPQSDTDSVNIEFVVKHGYSDTFATLVAPKRPVDFESDPNLSSEIDIHTSKRASASSSVNELFSDISFDSVDVVNGEETPAARDGTFLPTSLRSEPLEDPPLAFHRLPSLPEIPSSSSTTPDKDVQTKSAPDLAVEVKTSPPPIAPKPVISRSSGTELQTTTVVASTSSTSYTSTTAISLTVPSPTAQTAASPGSDNDTPSNTTITQGTKSSSIMVRSSNTPVLTASHWGPEKEVEVSRDPSKGLGISIVGGKVDLFQGSTNQGNAISGIFIKNVLADSPAGRNGMLKTGDRIMEVDGVDLRNASHEKAVEVIRGAGNPVRFKIQSLMQWSKDGNNDLASSPDVSASPSQIRNDFESCPENITVNSPVSLRKTPSPLVIQDGISQNELAPPRSPVSPGSPSKSPLLEIEESDSSDDEDSREGQGKTRSKAGYEIDRSSAGNVRRSKAEAQEDPDEEDEFGYTMNKIKKKYLNLNGELLMVELDRGPAGLGLSLAGNKDRMKMSTFIVGLHPSGYAFKDGRIQVGDEILEVNGVVLHNRCHLNSSAIIKSISGASIKFILLRRENAVQELAVKPITQFPVRLDDETPEERYAKYKGLRVLTLKKGNQGLGIMIIEGKHAEAGQGIFISDIQEGSLAEQSGLQVGDMILAVNAEELVGADYDTATSILRRTEGIIRLVVSSPSKVKDDATTPSKDRSRTPEVSKESEKPRIPPKPVLSSLKSSSSAKNVSLPVNLNSQPLIGSKSTPSLNTQSSTILQIKAPSSTPGSLCKTKSIYSEEPPADPTKCPIVPGTETTIEITKEKMGLGLSIVGGKDTLLGSIIIHEVYPDGAAAKDERLKPGDQILEVNNENFRDATHAKALAALRQTPAKVKMVVFREEGLTKEEDLYDVFDVELFKKPGKGLGLSIVGRKNGPGVFVTEIVKGSVAEADNRLMQGDQILCVNGNDLKTATQEEAAAILKTTVGKTSLKIGRLKGGSRRPNASDNPKSAGPEGSPSPPYRTVVLERGADGLGFTIVGGSGSPHGDLPIYVKTVFEKGAAAEHGGLERGDQIVAVDGRSLDGVTHQEAVAILKNVKTTVTLTVL